MHKNGPIRDGGETSSIKKTAFSLSLQSLLLISTGGCIPQVCKLFTWAVSPLPHPTLGTPVGVRLVRITFVDTRLGKLERITNSLDFGLSQAPESNELGLGQSLDCLLSVWLLFPWICSSCAKWRVSYFVELSWGSKERVCMDHEHSVTAPSLFCILS